MFDWDVVIIGGGPAGLTAGLYLSRGNRPTVLLEKEIFGGPIVDYDWIENYPGFSEGIAGAQLASEMVKQATKYGLKLEQAEVKGIELFSNGRCVACDGGAEYLTSVVIIAGGTHAKKLDVPGEEKLRGNGVFSCAFCDGNKFADGLVVVCGGGDSGLTEALYMTRIASKVIVIEEMPKLTASAILRERARANSKLEIRCGTKVQAIIGERHVEGIEILNNTGQIETLKADGVLAHVGRLPNTDYLKDIVGLDSGGQVIVNTKMETEVSNILAAGDIRSGSPWQVAAAVGDGAMAAITAERLLQQLE